MVTSPWQTIIVSLDDNGRPLPPDRDAEGAFEVEMSGPRADIEVFRAWLLETAAEQRTRESYPDHVMGMLFPRR